MRIGMILDKEFPPDMRVENEAVTLVQAGHDVFILCFDYNGKQTKSDKYRGIYRTRISKSRKWIKHGRGLINTIFDYYSRFWANRIKKFVRDNGIDVLHIHDLYLVGAGLKTQRQLIIPLVADLHENYVEGLKHYKFANTFPGKYIISISKWEKTEVEWCKGIDHLITVIDEAVERYYSLGIPKEKITVVANYVKQSEFLNCEDNREILNRYQDKFVISYIGGFDIHRGLETVIQAMPEIVKKCEKVKLVLVGKGQNSGELIQLAEEINVGKYISFEGWQPPSNLPSYIKTSDVCLIPHLKTVHTDNTIPHKLFHYMLLEKPVVATNCNPIERIINETKCGLVYKSNDSNGLAECITKLYKDSELRKKMGKNGKKAVMGKYNWEKTSKHLIDLYSSF